MRTSLSPVDTEKEALVLYARGEVAGASTSPVAGKLAGDLGKKIVLR